MQLSAFERSMIDPAPAAIEIALEIAGRPLGPPSTSAVTAVVRTTSAPRISVSLPAPAVQPPTAVSPFADRMALARVQVVPSTAMTAARAPPAAMNLLRVLAFGADAGGGEGQRRPVVERGGGGVVVEEARGLVGGEVAGGDPREEVAQRVGGGVRGEG